mmetsp:Transcript_30229/g.69296  ORF Transcript_30229/g.69296 Transcript_30229/m.69296 type:complete len:187 (-) Transcript_30229:156-716(-)
MRSELRSESFNVATMAFGIRNVIERDAVLCEIHRVLVKPSSVAVDGAAGAGRMAILEFSEPDGTSIMNRLARSFIRHVVPRLGAVLSGNPTEYMHLQNSIKHFPTPREFIQQMEEEIECEVGDDSVRKWQGGASSGGADVKQGAGEGNGNERYYGAYRLEKLIQLNFGSVQLYIATPIIKSTLPST